MAGQDVGEGTRLAAATGAYICFEDEAGQNLRPPKARTWARRGRTPVVTVSGKGSGRVSVAGLVCLRPGSRGHLFYRVRIHRGRKGERRSMSEADYAELIAAAHNQLHAPVILIWDNLNTHISAAMRAFIQAHPDWLTEVRLPAYAPDLNPAEGVWANMKNGLGNLAARNVDQLAAIVGRDRQEPAQENPVPARAHRRVPRPDRAHPRTPTALDARPRPFKLCSYFCHGAISGLFRAYGCSLRASAASRTLRRTRGR